MNQKSLNEQNNQWFGRDKAFNFLEVDLDNIIRIKKVTNFLKNYKKNYTKKQIKLLDVGCGNGYLGEKFLKIGYNVYGMDISQRNIVQAKKKDIKAKLSDVNEAFPYNNNTFDVVFAGEIIEHLFDTDLFLSEINRVLKTNGLVIITTPNLAHLPERFRLMRGLNPNQIQPTHHFLKHHIRYFTFNLLKKILKKHRFKILKQESSIVVFSRKSENIELVDSYSKWLADIFPSFGSFIIMYAKKVA